MSLRVLLLAFYVFTLASGTDLYRHKVNAEMMEVQLARRPFTAIEMGRSLRAN